jgi:hypothetical protein
MHIFLSADYKKHVRVHTKERPFSCSSCHLRFSDGSALRKHEKRRHQVAGAAHQICCLGCRSVFVKEEAFFRHASHQVLFHLFVLLQ